MNAPNDQTNAPTNGQTIDKAVQALVTAAEMVLFHLRAETIAGKTRAANYNNSIKQWAALIDHAFIDPHAYAHKLDNAFRHASTDEANQIQVHPNGILWLQGAFDLQTLRNNLTVR